MIGKGLFHRRRRNRLSRDKQIVITAEKTETFVIRQEPRVPVQAFCTVCDQEVGCLTVEQVTKLTTLSARTIFRLVEAGEIHSYETIEGHLLLCPNSIAEFIRL